MPRPPAVNTASWLAPKYVNCQPHWLCCRWTRALTGSPVASREEFWWPSVSTATSREQYGWTEAGAGQRHYCQQQPRTSFALFSIKCKNTLYGKQCNYFGGSPRAQAGRNT